jgi:hypothetical protein
VPVIAVIHAVAGEAPDVSLLLFPLILLASPVFSAFTLLLSSLLLLVLLLFLAFVLLLAFLLFLASLLILASLLFLSIRLLDFAAIGISKYKISDWNSTNY